MKFSYYILNSDGNKESISEVDAFNLFKKGGHLLGKITKSTKEITIII